ncbi:ABC transporter ATP-binding protein [Clostridium intestinale]|uniref:ABC transporter ATP-binding protein n=1 Tax=Clostridium intestinale TaxID=36845 RepID=A0A7D6VU81_9CLOT|nr:ABC transporter ATP-binding protein [Clostridium intestinale]QLY80190.1 ABC transporter ATP-binding protein [Clostridium intestinale]
MKFLKHYKKYIDKYKKPFVVALFFLSIEAICDLMQPTIMSKIVDEGVANRNMDYVLVNAMIMFGVTLMGAIGATMRSIIASHVSQKFGRDLRVNMYEKIQSFSFDNIDNFDKASLVTRLTNDVNQVQMFVNGMMRVFVKAPMLCIGSLIMAARLNLSLSVIFLIIIPLVIAIIILNMRIGYPNFRKIQKSLDNVNSNIREYLSGVRVVKAFNRFKYEEERFGKKNDELFNVSTKAMKTIAIFSPTITTTVNIGIIAVLWLGNIKINNGGIQVGAVMAFINYMTQILSSLMTMNFVFNMFVKARASSERIVEVFDQKPTIENGNEEVKKGELQINFEDVSFTYSGGVREAALKNINLNINSGELLGIIGSTGSGKSTLVKLLLRFYDVTKGKIKINGVDIKNISMESLRDRISIVPQASLLFTGSIVDNIRWGKAEADIEEVINAASLAEAHEFILKQAKGYDTKLGQGGVNLSGGQKQRISIARALIKKPHILILDDSTSAVDVTTEKKIKEGLKKFSKDLVTIIISQKITSVMEADNILVLDDGEMVGLGSHNELMDSCSVYKDIFNSQIGKELI